MVPTAYQEVIAYSRYSKYIPELKRRESWEETVSRLMNYINKKVALDDIVYDDLYWAIVNLEVMPSMRLLMTAGDACERDNISAYNCAYSAINSKRSFSEALYILMNGTGVGFSCERQEISKLPPLPETLKDSYDTIVVGDSKIGWAKAYKKLISSLWEGDIPNIDYSKIRPTGARLKTFGGRASGPEPLKRLFDFTINKFKEALGRKFNSLEIHEILCMVGEVVVVGGVRRSALISLSNLTDRRMREAKMGAWYVDKPYLGLSNNSVAYTEKPDAETFLEEWLSLVKSKSGERGIFNRVAAQKQASKFGRDSTLAYGCNPCSEIILRDKQFCNLTEVVVRSTDTYEDLKRKIELATILGTIQSTLTNFNFLSEEWKKNTEEERLLGVSLTGIMDHSVLSNKQPETYSYVGTGESKEVLPIWLDEFRDHARKTNAIWAEKLDIQPSASITCVKPSGTVSQLVDSASGIHTRHSPYYIRRIRMDKKDPIYTFLKEIGVSVEDDSFRPDSTAIFSFPQRAPEGAVCRSNISAIQHLELWLLYQRHWCEHKPSITISVRDDEWAEVGAWVWKHFDEISGISFLPYSDHSYTQAPYEEINEEQYKSLLAITPQHVDWSKFIEEDDFTEGAQTLACSAGNCEI